MKKIINKLLEFFVINPVCFLVCAFMVFLAIASIIEKIFS